MQLVSICEGPSASFSSLHWANCPRKATRNSGAPERTPSHGPGVPGSSYGDGRLNAPATAAAASACPRCRAQFAPTWTCRQQYAAKIRVEIKVQHRSPAVAPAAEITQTTDRTRHRLRTLPTIRTQYF